MTLIRMTCVIERLSGDHILKQWDDAVGAAWEGFLTGAQSAVACTFCIRSVRVENYREAKIGTQL